MSVEKLAHIWPEWEVEKQLGKGSYGVVYKAVRRDNNVESHAAIKVISVPADDSEVDSLRSEGLTEDGTRTYFKGIVDDFVGEIQLMESLKGVQNIVSVEDYKVVEKTDSVGWDIYIRMELLTPFNAFLCDKKMSEKDVIKLGIDICTALEICSQRNIIHRDIKPENIFINDFGYFKLGDFGIARTLENMTGGLSQKGTFNYMAPEVANSNTYDARVDTYSLGIVLYRLLNGNRLPFIESDKQLLNPNERKNAVERRIHGEKPPAPCDASPEMADLILRACAYNPDMRFASATAMKEALISVGNGTYVPLASELDQTTVLNHAQANTNATTVLNNTSQTTKKLAVDNNKNEAIPTFGKKKSKAPKVIAVILVLALLLVGAFVAYPYLQEYIEGEFIENNAPEGSDTNHVSDNDEKLNGKEDNSNDIEDQIQSIIGDAEKFANNNSYEKAIDKIKAGLVSYPDSVELQNKLDEYTTQVAKQNKQKVLGEAVALANKKDYLGAMKKIEAAQKSLPGDVDYEIAYDNYCGAYEDSVISQADSLAIKNDYEGAIALIEAAKVNVKNSTKLEAAKNKYALNLPATYLHKLQPTVYSTVDSRGESHAYNKYYIIKGKVISFLGDTYTEGLLFKRGNRTPTYIEYKFNGEYTKLTGKVTMIETGSITGVDDFTARSSDLVYLEFVADGEKIYTSPLTNPTMDIELDIDLENVNVLQIYIRPEYEQVSSFMSDHKENSCIILTDMALYK